MDEGMSHQNLIRNTEKTSGERGNDPEKVDIGN